MKNPAAWGKLRPISGTIPEKFFGHESPTHDSGQYSELFWPLIIIYKEFRLFFHTYVAIKIFNLGAKTTCVENWLPIANYQNRLPVDHNSITNSKTVGLGLVAKIQMM